MAFTKTTVDLIIDLFQAMREKTRSDLGHIPFRIELMGTEDDETLLANCFAAIDKFKEAKLQCFFKFEGISRFKHVANQIST